MFNPEKIPDVYVNEKKTPKNKEWFKMASKNFDLADKSNLDAMWKNMDALYKKWNELTLAQLQS